MDDVGKAIGRRRRDFAIHLVDRLGIIAYRADRQRDIDGAGIADRLAGIEALQQGQVFGVAFHQVGQGVQDLFTGARRQVAPDARIEGGAGRSDGGVDIAGIARGHAVDAAPVARRDIVEGPP